MADSFGDRLKHAWNAFTGLDRFAPDPYQYGPSYGIRNDKIYFSYNNEKNLVAVLYNQIAVDVGEVDIRHIRRDENDRYVSTIQSGLNNCLTVEANVDQAAKELIRDIVLTMFNQGHAAVVPIDTTFDIKKGDSYDILTLRVGEIVEWYPQHVRVRVYNENDGEKHELVFPKKKVAIIANPFYEMMNRPNSTLQRLIQKLNLLDTADVQQASGKLDIIIQLPYVIKTEARREQAEVRRKDIEMQLTGSKYGIAYADAAERITQLNRPAENSLLTQVNALKEELYSQLGITKEVFAGTASEAVMINYHNRTIRPILSAITGEFYRKFLTKTARTQRQAIAFFRDPFSLVPVSQIADIADKFTRNEVLSPNEVRAIIGYRPSDDGKSDELRNRNMPPVEDPLQDPAVDTQPAGFDIASDQPTDAFSIN